MESGRPFVWDGWSEFTPNIKPERKTAVICDDMEMWTGGTGGNMVLRDRNVRRTFENV